MPEPIDMLFEAVQGADCVLILPHNDPDPDAIAGAVALHYLLEERLGIPGKLAFRGIVGRAENKALLRFLRNPFRRLSEADLQKPWPIALVDSQPGAGNNPLPANRRVAIAIDHHPWRETTAGVTFADIRPNVGATSTILTEYLQAARLEPPPTLATALFYGIKTDTMALGRGAGPGDVSAYFYLQPRIDVEALVEIERAQVPTDYFRSFVTALQATRLYDDVAISYVGPMGYPDLAAELADLLLRLKGICWVICMGVYKDELILAIRTRSPRDKAGSLALRVVGDLGSAGGHGVMAGGQILLDGRAAEELAADLSRRALRYLKEAPDIPGKPLL